MVEIGGISATEKKRIRDRRAQQKHRERKDLRTKQLEDQVAFCQRNHEPDHVQALMEKVGQLEAVNETLRMERDKLLDLVNNFQESLTTFFVDQHHRPINVRKDTCNSFLPPTTRPVGGVCQSRTNVTPISDPTSTPAETNVTATRRQIPLPLEQPTRIRPNDGDISAVDFAGIGDAAISSSAGTVVDVTDGRQPSSSQPSNYPSPTPLIRDCRALGIPPREQTQIQHLVEDFPLPRMDHISQPTLSERSTITTVTPIEQAGTEPTALSTSAHSPETRLSPSVTSNENAAVSVPIANVSWLSLPTNTTPYESKLDCNWLYFPHAVADSPDVPQPEDLLFGSRKNLLANGIHKALRAARVAEPERMAMGWLLYIFSRWRIIPTRENFEKIPYFLRPVPEQISQPHPARLDMVPWPSLRLALMNQHSDSQLDETLELLACCLKLRWPWGKEFLQMREDGSRQLVDEFLKLLMSLDGWGITREFAVVYPHLIEGLNLHIIEYNVA